MPRLRVLGLIIVAAPVTAWLLWNYGYRIEPRRYRRGYNWTKCPFRGQMVMFGNDERHVAP